MAAHTEGHRRRKRLLSVNVPSLYFFRIPQWAVTWLDRPKDLPYIQSHSLTPGSWPSCQEITAALLAPQPVSLVNKPTTTHTLACSASSAAQRTPVQSPRDTAARLATTKLSYRVRGTNSPKNPSLDPSSSLGGKGYMWAMRNLRSLRDYVHHRFSRRLLAAWPLEITSHSLCPLTHT